jgi:hypothetical protein
MSIFYPSIQSSFLWKLTSSFQLIKMLVKLMCSLRRHFQFFFTTLSFLTECIQLTIRSAKSRISFRQISSASKSLPYLHRPRRSSWFGYSGMGIVAAPLTEAYAPNVPNAHSTSCMRSLRQWEGRELWRYSCQTSRPSSSKLIAFGSLRGVGGILLDWQLAPEVYQHQHQS